VVTATTKIEACLSLYRSPGYSCMIVFNQVWVFIENVFFFIPIPLFKQCPMKSVNLDIWSTQKMKMTIQWLLCTICMQWLFPASNFFLNFPIRSYLKTMSRDGNHLAFLIDTTKTHFVQDHPRNILAKFAVK